MNSDGTSLTIMIPKESGPKACSRVEKETLPGSSQLLSLKLAGEVQTILQVLQAYSHCG